MPGEFLARGERGARVSRASWRGAGGDVAPGGLLGIQEVVSDGITRHGFIAQPGRGCRGQQSSEDAAAAPGCGDAAWVGPAPLPAVPLRQDCTVTVLRPRKEPGR